jgi:hypothetical protein
MAKLKANAKLLENVKLVTDNGRGHNVVCDLSEASGGTNVTMRVNINSKTRKGLIEAAWRRTEANCPVMFVYKEAIPVKVEAQINVQ